MSLSERDADRPDATEGNPSRRTILLALSAALTAPVLAACGGSGFRPLHGSLGSGSSVSEKLAKVEVAPIPGRVGQRVRNELLFGIHKGGSDKAVDPNYRLEVITRESLGSTLVQLDGSASSGFFNLEAKFQMIRISDKAVILEGTSYGRAGFERFSSIYSNVRAREDAENRAALTVGQDIKQRLEAYLATAA